MKHSAAAFIFVVGAVWQCHARAETPTAGEPTAEELRFFETSVRPVLVEHCQKCHGPQKQWSNFRLDTRDGLLKGGDFGAAIIPGNPEASRLIGAVRHADPDLRMPPEEKLADDQIAALVRWVEMGAPFPAAAPASARTRDPNHWAFQPPADQPLPVVMDASWPQTPTDNFILARIEQAGLAPAPRADRRALIRRVTFDLTGLPPTPGEVAAFLADESPTAFETVVDRLLASPHYGERWGRHWLDVARYADSNGLDENICHGNAWRYRDYVVASFNRDKPFDQFIVEQLAGDLLPPAEDQSIRHEQLIATGFISIGPKVLAEVDQAKMQMDMVDEQLDTVGRVFMGLTLGCARCHDHKFDPIDTADYYGLAGIFKSTRTMDNYTKIARWHEHPLPSPEATALQAAYDADLAAKKQAVETYVAQANQQVRDSLAADAPAPENLESMYPEATKAELAKLREELTTVEKNPPELPSAMGVTEDAIVDLAIHIRGNPLKLGDVAPRHTPPVMRGPAAPAFPSSQSGRRELADWLVDPRHPLTGRVLVNRFWRWHFGRGLVRTTDNFGLLGEAPSHPELLDWLARRFVADGWSLKSLHRLILNSATYQQSTTPTEATLAGDPENRLFSRCAVRRLSAEEVRDALLAVGGDLDPTFGGTLLTIKNRGFFFDHTSIDLTDYRSRRRSLYLPVVRNNVYDLFQLLDFPDPAISSGDRASTTVAPQALLLLNSDLVMQSAEFLAGRVLSGPAADADRIALMYRIAYGRDASPDELSSGRAFLTQVDAALAGSLPDLGQRERQTWTALCHTLLAANEFIYLQ